MVTYSQDPTGLRMEAAEYRLFFPADRPFVIVDDATGERWAELFVGASVHAREGLDETAQIHPPHVTETDDGVQVTVQAVSSLWEERSLVFDCRETHFGVCVRVKGHGHPTDLHLLGGYYSGALRFGSGFFLSGARFRSLFNPEPWGSERRVISASESTVIDVCGSGALPGRRHWIFTPAPFCYGVSMSTALGGGALREASVGADQGGAPTGVGQGGPRGGTPGANPAEAEGPWLMLGLAARPGEYQFTGFHYDGVEDGFSLRLTYEGQTPVNGDFESPTVLFQMGAPDPYTGLERYVQTLQAMGLVELPEEVDRPTWWTEPIQCGWGAQCHLANLAKGRAPDFCTQQNYDGFLAALETHGVKAGTVVIDDKWSANYGTCEADPAKWPDLKGWIAQRHNAGQKVLLWWKAWDAEGLPPEQCVRNSAGFPVTADPTNPDYEESLRKAVRLMLSPAGYDADGFKVDFSARTPSGPSLTRQGPEWGAELLHKLLWILRDEAKRVKPDALVMTHTPNPYFASVTDMIRLNDVNTGSPVVAQMTHRARVARAACSNRLIDTDNWPMPSLAAWREYLEVQNDLGIPSLYFATDLDCMQSLEEQDYANLRRVFTEARSKLLKGSRR